MDFTIDELICLRSALVKRIQKLKSFGAHETMVARYNQILYKVEVLIINYSME